MDNPGINNQFENHKNLLDLFLLGSIRKICLRLMARWDCGLESRLECGRLSVVSSMCCLFDGLIPRPEVSYRLCMCASLSAIRRNNNPLHLPWVGRNGQIKF